MSNQHAFSQYRQDAALGATPLGRVVALYQAMLQDFRRAMAAHEQGQVERRVNSINHALTILAELQGALDFERGGAAAKQLDRFYNLNRAEIFRVSVAPSREGFQRLIDLFTPVYQAWEEISRQLPQGIPGEAAPAARTSMTSPSSSVASSGAEEAPRSTMLWRG
jgi:flagellar protein FliS